MKEVGVQADKESIDNMIKSINGRKLHDLVSEGQSKLASISAPAAVGIFKLIDPFLGASAAAAPKEEAKKEEPKKEEKKEEEADVDMGGLFGDDYWASCGVS